MRASQQSPIRPVLLALALLGCSPVSEPGLPPGTQPLAGALDTLVHAHYSGIQDRRRLVIRDAAAWEQFWAQAMATVSRVPPTPAVDFTTSIVIAASMGNRPNGGHAIGIESLNELDNTLYAVVEERSVGLGCVTTQAITAPLIAVRVARPGAAVVFVETTRRIDC